MVWKMIFLFNRVNLMFHVNLPGCMFEFTVQNDRLKYSSHHGALGIFACEFTFFEDGLKRSILYLYSWVGFAFHRIHGTGLYLDTYMTGEKWPHEQGGIVGHIPYMDPLGISWRQKEDIIWLHFEMWNLSWYVRKPHSPVSFQPFFAYTKRSKREKLFGGFHPFEKYSAKWIISPGIRDEH